MKKSIMMLALAMGLSALGCGSSTPKKATTPKATEVKQPEPSPEPDTTDGDGDGDVGDGDLEGGGTEEPANP